MTENTRIMTASQAILENPWEGFIAPTSKESDQLAKEDVLNSNPKDLLTQDTSKHNAKGDSGQEKNSTSTELTSESKLSIETSSATADPKVPPTPDASVQDSESENEDDSQASKVRHLVQDKLTTVRPNNNSYLQENAQMPTSIVDAALIGKSIQIPHTAAGDLNGGADREQIDWLKIYGPASHDDQFNKVHQEGLALSSKKSSQSAAEQSSTEPQQVQTIVTKPQQEQPILNDSPFLRQLESILVNHSDTTLHITCTEELKLLLDVEKPALKIHFEIPSSASNNSAGNGFYEAILDYLKSDKAVLIQDLTIILPDLEAQDWFALMDSVRRLHGDAFKTLLPKSLITENSTKLSESLKQIHFKRLFLQLGTHPSAQTLFSRAQTVQFASSVESVTISPFAGPLNTFIPAAPQTLFSTKTEEFFQAARTPSSMPLLHNALSKKLSTIHFESQNKTDPIPDLDEVIKHLEAQMPVMQMPVLYLNKLQLNAASHKSWFLFNGFKWKQAKQFQKIAQIYRLQAQKSKIQAQIDAEIESLYQHWTDLPYLQQLQCLKHIQQLFVDYQQLFPKSKSFWDRWFKKAVFDYENPRTPHLAYQKACFEKRIFSMVHNTFSGQKQVHRRQLRHALTLLDQLSDAGLQDHDAQLRQMISMMFNDQEPNIRMLLQRSLKTLAPRVIEKMQDFIADILPSLLNLLLAAGTVLLFIKQFSQASWWPSLYYVMPFGIVSQVLVACFAILGIFSILSNFSVMQNKIITPVVQWFKNLLEKILTTQEDFVNLQQSVYKTTPGL